MKAENEQEPDAMDAEEGDGEWERMIEVHDRDNAMADDAVLRRALKDIQCIRTLTPPTPPTRARSPNGWESISVGEAPNYRPVYEGSSPSLRLATHLRRRA